MSITRIRIHLTVQQGVVKCGGYRYDDGTKYIGDWNHKGQKHGLGHLVLSDGTRYDGCFINGICSGLGVMKFSDGAKLAIHTTTRMAHSINVFRIGSKGNLCRVGSTGMAYSGVLMA